jgi:hypothetical protein
MQESTLFFRVHLLSNILPAFNRFTMTTPLNVGLFGTLWCYSCSFRLLLRTVILLITFVLRAGIARRNRWLVLLSRLEWVGFILSTACESLSPKTKIASCTSPASFFCFSSPLRILWPCPTNPGSCLTFPSSSSFSPLIFSWIVWKFLCQQIQTNLET